MMLLGQLFGNNVPDFNRNLFPRKAFQSGKVNQIQKLLVKLDFQLGMAVNAVLDTCIANRKRLDVFKRNRLVCLIFLIILALDLPHTHASASAAVSAGTRSTSVARSRATLLRASISLTNTPWSSAACTVRASSVTEKETFRPRTVFASSRSRVLKIRFWTLFNPTLSLGPARSCWLKNSIWRLGLM